METDKAKVRRKDLLFPKEGCEIEATDFQRVVFTK